MLKECISIISGLSAYSMPKLKIR